MNHAFILTLGLSLAGSATCLLVLASGAIIRKRFRGSWIYYLWLIVLLCFIIPVPLNLPFASDSLRDVSAALSSAMTVRELSPDSPAANDSALAAVPQAPRYDKTSTPEKGTGQSAAAPVDGAVTPAKDSVGHISAITAMLLRFLPYLWLAGAAAVLLWTLTAYILMLRRLRRERTLLTTGRVPVYTSRCITTPLLVGILRPAVYLPTDFNNSELAIRHELTHLRRGDLWLKWLLQLSVCAHWFNPLAWLMRRELNRLCELACDISTVRELGAADRRTYGVMLLDTAGASAGMGFLLVVALGRDKQILKERLREIMNSKKASRKAVAAMSALFAVVLTAAVIFGALFSGCTVNSPAASEQNSPAAAKGDNVSAASTPAASPEQSPTLSDRVVKITALVSTKLVDLPFDNDDADVIGTWLPVGKADSVSSFVPKKPPSSSTWELAISKDAQGLYGFYTQHEGFHEVLGYPRWSSAVSYEITEIDGVTYLFIEQQKSSAHSSYFVFEKLSDTVPVHNNTPPNMPSSVLIISDMS